MPTISATPGEFDFVVVGSGSAGATLAARLAEDRNVSVALVEAGTHATQMEAKMPVACGKMQMGEHDWQFETEPSETAFAGMKNRRNRWPRGKCLGGSSVLNYMAYVRGAKEDFDTWEREFGAEGWGWDAMLPFFMKSEDFLSPNSAAVVDKSVHGTGGPLGISVTQGVSEAAHAFVAGAEELGFTRGDYNNGQMCGVTSLFQQTIRNGARSDTYTAFITSQPDKPNLTVITSAQAAKILLKDDGAAGGGKKAVGVEVVDISNKKHKRVQIMARKEVILSCGAIQSPHVLMLSGIGPRAELERAGIKCEVDLPRVGKGLEDHIVGLIRVGASPSKRLTGLATAASAEGLPGALPSLLSWLFFGRGLHASSSLDATLFYKTAAFAQAHPGYGPDAQIELLCSPGDANTFENNLNMSEQANYHKPHYASGDGQSLLLIPTLLHTHSRGSIEIVSADPLVYPKIHANYLTDERDMAALVEIFRKTLALAKTPAMKAAGLGEPIFDEAILRKHGGDVNSAAFLEEFARSHASTDYHPTCTCKIGEVVDPCLKVIGVANLRVADASVMPTVISGNTNAPCIAIGERAADFIKQQYGMKESVITKVQPTSMLRPLAGAAVLVLVAAVASQVIGVSGAR